MIDGDDLDGELLICLLPTAYCLLTTLRSSNGRIAGFQSAGEGFDSPTEHFLVWFQNPLIARSGFYSGRPLNKRNRVLKRGVGRVLVGTRNSDGM